MSDWFKFKYVAEQLDNRKWWWGSGASQLKYINIRVDTRDNHCVVTFEDRNGKVFADSLEKFTEIMKALDEKTTSFTFEDMRDCMRRYENPK